MKKYKLLVLPFLLTLGPFWMVSFTGGEWSVLRIAGMIGAVGLSLGLIYLLSKVYYLQQRIEWLEDSAPDNYSPSESHADTHKSHFDV